MSVVFITPELSPFAKSGELADVASSLPKYLMSKGVSLQVFLPRYRQPAIESLAMDCIVSDLSVPLGDKKIKGRVFLSKQEKYDLYLIDSPQYFWRENIYGAGNDHYLDNDERFVFFNRAVLEYLRKERKKVDIFHCNNWPTALTPLLVRAHPAFQKRFPQSACLLTLHNIAYQGIFPQETHLLTGLDWDLFSSRNIFSQGRFNFLKTGLLFTDVINTVSATYRREILSKKYGFGLDPVLKQRRQHLFSIRNGIDFELWDPKNDPYIAQKYLPADHAAKKQNKQGLIQELGLSISETTPLLGITSYIAANKGFDLLLDGLPIMLKKNLGLIVQGRGDAEYEKRLLDLQVRFPQKIAVRLDRKTGLTHKIVAGCDLLLIPSRYEPCGLNQLYGFRYGTVPIARATGGLKETVKPVDTAGSAGNGFIFREYSTRSLLQAVDQALVCYADSQLWARIKTAGARQNFSWQKAAKKYIKLYRHALQIRQGKGQRFLAGENNDRL